jgi:hypothetical protein
MWAGMERKWLAKLSLSEREKFESLNINNDRDAFRILQNWSQTDSPDFYAHCETLGRRLDIKLSGAAKLRRRFCSLGILRQTDRYIPRKKAARYKWTGNGNQIGAAKSTHRIDQSALAKHKRKR